jgi:hypothetical protein
MEGINFGWLAVWVLSPDWLSRKSDFYQALGRGVRAVPRLCIVYPGIFLTNEENHGKYREHLDTQLYRECCGPGLVVRERDASQ